MHTYVLRLTAALTNAVSIAKRDDRGVTTVEWLGMAAVVVIVVAFLLPQVRSASANMWESVVDELDGLFS